MGSLINLYTKCFINKKNIIIISLSMIIVIISSFSSIDFNITKEEYLLNSNDLLKSYINNVSFTIFLINSIIVPLVISDLVKEEHVTLYNIVKSICGDKLIFSCRILSLISLLVYLSIIEFLIIVIPPLVFYPFVNFSVYCFMNIIILFLYSIFCLIVVYLILDKIKSILVSVIPILMFIILSKLGEYIELFSMDHFFTFEELNKYKLLYIILFFTLDLFIFWLRYAVLNYHEKKLKKS